LLLAVVLSKINVEPGPTEIDSGSWNSGALDVGNPPPAISGAVNTFTGSISRTAG